MGRGGDDEREGRVVAMAIKIVIMVIKVEGVLVMEIL